MRKLVNTLIAITALFALSVPAHAGGVTFSFGEITITLGDDDRQSDGVIYLDDYSAPRDYPRWHPRYDDYQGYPRPRHDNYGGYYERPPQREVCELPPGNWRRQDEVRAATGHGCTRNIGSCGGEVWCKVPSSHPSTW